MWLICAFGSAAFAGATAILAKCGIRRTNSNLATAIRTVVVLLFAWLMVFLTGSQSTLTSISAQTLCFLVLSGLATGASWLCYFRALQLGEIDRVTPIDKSSTVLTMLLAMLFLGEPLTLFKGIGMVTIGAGTWLMIRKPRVSGESVSVASGESRILDAKKKWWIYAVLSAVFAALTSILGKVGIQGVESNLGTAIRTGVVLIMAWVVVFVTGSGSEIRRIDKKSWLFLCLSGVTTGASWLCYYRALQDGPASVVVPIDKLSIIPTVIFSYLVFKERLTKQALAGLMFIVGGTLVLLL